ncbi:MAG: hypothetical protein HWN67_15805 [Candidatus Helarchaeota archaeon]|nr:hypothetical protein [Candidatus Helarchaeota archaeon]
MKKISLFLILSTIVFGLILLLPSVQPVRAVGAVFEAPNNEQFNVTDSNIWIQDITVCNTSHPALNANFSVGDRIRINVTKTNNTILTSFPPFWIADTIFGHYQYYNTSEGTWTDWSGETIVGGYNNTNPNYNFSGEYFYYSTGLMQGFMSFQAPLMDFIPQNFSAANHTIVNMTYWLFSSMGPTNFNHYYTASNRTWVITNGTENDPWGIKLEVSFNAEGFCTRNAMYFGGASWQLVYESRTLTHSVGFAVTVGDSFVTTITVSSPMVSNYSVGDKFKIDVSTINYTWISSLSTSGWTSYALFGRVSAYNSAQKNWTTINNGSEILLAAYHSMYPYYNLSGTYNFYSFLLINTLSGQGLPLMDFIPLDYNAVNHTIVNQTYTSILMSGAAQFNHTDPAGIPGTWILINGTENDPWAFKVEFTFNSMGICTRSAMYFGGVSGWQLVFEAKIGVEEELSQLDLLLLIMMAASGGDIISGDFMGIGITAGIFFIPLLIGLGIRKRGK